MVEKKYIGLTDADSYEINQEVRGHTKACAYNMFMHSVHDNCKDCQCHHYRKY